MEAAPHQTLRRLFGHAASLALHAALLALVATVPLRGRFGSDPAAPAGGTAVTYVVAPKDAQNPTGDRVLAPDAEDADAGSETAPPRVPGAAFDIAKIRDRRNWLFPFVTTDLLFLQPGEQESQSAPAKLMNPYGSGKRRPSRPPLAKGDADVQQIVDRAWSRRDRWVRFQEIAALVRDHNPDDGRVPTLLRAYLDQNLLQPYHDAETRDPRFWAMLACVADHVDFIDWVRSFAREHPSSRATTDLLFLLDELAQGSRDTLLMLLATDPESDLAHTRATQPEGYELAVSLRRQYGEWLSQHDLGSTIAIKRWHDRLRLRLLSTIVESTPAGYREADARFLAGEILFNQNNLTEALRMWRDIEPHPGDSYVPAYTEVLRNINSPAGASPAEINRILGAEYRRWLDFSVERLRQFGYAFNTF